MKGRNPKIGLRPFSVCKTVDYWVLTQNIFAKADIARDSGDEKMEKAYLDDIIQMYAWRNDDIREIAEWLDRRYLNKYIDKMQKEVRSTVIEKTRL